MPNGFKSIKVFDKFQCDLYRQVPLSMVLCRLRARSSTLLTCFPTAARIVVAKSAIASLVLIPTLESIPSHSSVPQSRWYLEDRVAAYGIRPS
jgi:hypothetical protein